MEILVLIAEQVVVDVDFKIVKLYASVLMDPVLHIAVLVAKVVSYLVDLCSPF